MNELRLELMYYKAIFEQSNWNYAQYSTKDKYLVSGLHGLLHKLCIYGHTPFIGSLKIKKEIINPKLTTDWHRNPANMEEIFNDLCNYLLTIDTSITN